MADRRTKSFRKQYDDLDPATRALYDQAYKNYKKDQTLVNFEKKGSLKEGHKLIPVYGARIDGNWRALAMEKGPDRHWYWLGIHTDYDRILKSLKKK